MNRKMSILFFLLFACPKILMADTSDEYPLWKLIAQADLIAVGVLHVPRDELAQGLQQEASHYSLINVVVKETLKGETNNSSLEIVYWPTEEHFNPSARLLQELDGQEAIVFLDERDREDVKRVQFAGYTSTALQRFDRQTVSRIQDEVTYQNTVLHAFTKAIDPSHLPHYPEVKKLIHDLTNRKKELDNFKALEQIGKEAVPAIIYLMDDFRRLPIKQISLTCPPGWFESLRHYSPERVVDALAAILNQITGAHFGSIYNGASKRERQRAIDGWRIYLHYQQLQKPSEIQ